MYSFVRDAVPCKRRRSRQDRPAKRRRIKIRPLSSSPEPEPDERQHDTVATADAETIDLDSPRLVVGESATKGAEVEKNKLYLIEKRIACYDVLHNSCNPSLKNHLETFYGSKKQYVTERYFQKCYDVTKGDINKSKFMMKQIRSEVRINMSNSPSSGDEKKSADVTSTESAVNKKNCHSLEEQLKLRISKIFTECFGKDHMASDWQIINEQSNINDISSNVDECSKLCQISNVRSLKLSTQLLNIQNSNNKKVNNLKDYKDVTKNITDTYYIKKKPAISKEHSISPIILARGISKENVLSKDKLSVGSSTTNQSNKVKSANLEKEKDQGIVNAVVQSVEGIDINNPIPSVQSVFKFELKFKKLINLKDAIFQHKTLEMLADYFVNSQILNNSNLNFDNNIIEDLIVKFNNNKHNMAYLSGCLICVFIQIVNRFSVKQNAAMQKLYLKYMETIIKYVQGIDDNLWKKWFLPDSFLDWCIVLFGIFNKSQNGLSLSINDTVIANAYTYYAKVKHKQYVFVKTHKEPPKPVKKGIFEFSNIDNELDTSNEVISMNNDNTKHQELLEETINCVQQEIVSSNHVTNLSVNNLQQTQDIEISNHCAETIRKIKQEYVAENCLSSTKVFSENSTNIPFNSSQGLKKTITELPCQKIKQENMSGPASSAKGDLQNSTNAPNKSKLPCQKIKQENMSGPASSAKVVLQNSTNAPNKSCQNSEINNTCVELPCQQIKEEKVSDEDDAPVTDIVSKSPVGSSSVETNHQELDENDSRIDATNKIKLRNIAELICPISQTPKILVRPEFGLAKSFDANKIRSLFHAHPKRLESEPIMSDNSHTNNSLALLTNRFEIPVVHNVNRNKKITKQIQKSNTQVPLSNANAFYTVGNNPQRFNITCGGGSGPVVQNLSPYYKNISANSSTSNIESTIDNVVSNPNKSVTDYISNCYTSNNYNATSESNSTYIGIVPSVNNIGNSFHSMSCSSSSVNNTHCAVPTPSSLQLSSYNYSIAHSQQLSINNHPLLPSFISGRPNHENLNKKQPPSTNNSAPSSCTSMNNNTLPGQNNSYYNPKNIPNTNKPTAISGQPLMTAPFNHLQLPVINTQPLMTAPMNFQSDNYSSQASTIAPINDFRLPDNSAQTSPDLPDMRQPNLPNNMTSNSLCGAINCINAQVMVCKGCNSIHYCSTHCQKKDWPRHRGQCHLISIASK